LWQKTGPAQLRGSRLLLQPFSLAQIPKMAFSKLECTKRFTMLAEKLLNDLTDALEEEEHAMFEEINFSNGVLTIDMADGRSFVLNKQTPNLQVWLSSPISGP